MSSGVIAPPLAARSAPVQVLVVFLFDRAASPLAQQVDAGVADHREEPGPRIRSLHLVERPEGAQAAVLDGVPGRARVPGDPPGEVVSRIQVHEDLLLEPRGPLPVGQSRMLPGPCPLCQ